MVDSKSWLTREDPRSVCYEWVSQLCSLYPIGVVNGTSVTSLRVILIQSEKSWVLVCDGEYGPVMLSSWSFKVGESASIFLAKGVYIDSPYQKLLMHSRLTIYALDNLAIIGI